VGAVLGLKAELVEAHGGIFDVALDDEIVFTNRAAGCDAMPDLGEVLADLRRRVEGR
jgi:hypothetical protein